MGRRGRERRAGGAEARQGRGAEKAGREEERGGDGSRGREGESDAGSGKRWTEAGCRWRRAEADGGRLRTFGSSAGTREEKRLVMAGGGLSFQSFIDFDYSLSSLRLGMRSFQERNEHGRSIEPIRKHIVADWSTRNQ